MLRTMLKSKIHRATVTDANLHYVGSLTLANLWDRHNYLVRDGGHAAFLGSPAMFDAILTRFMADMAKRAQSVGRKGVQQRRSGAAA